MPLHYYPSFILLAGLAFYIFWSGRRAFRPRQPQKQSSAKAPDLR